MISNASSIPAATSAHARRSIASRFSLSLRPWMTTRSGSCTLNSYWGSRSTSSVTPIRVRRGNDLAAGAPSCGAASPTHANAPTGVLQLSSRFPCRTPPIGVPRLTVVGPGIRSRVSCHRGLVSKPGCPKNCGMLSLVTRNASGSDSRNTCGPRSSRTSHGTALSTRSTRANQPMTSGTRSSSPGGSVAASRPATPRPASGCAGHVEGSEPHLGVAHRCGAIKSREGS